MNDVTIRGRGAANPPSRFELIVYERDPDTPAGETPAPRTQYLKDTTRSIIATNDSPDVSFILGAASTFQHSMNRLISTNRSDR